ncbi:TetR/AcrR family transcriptional regulator [Streptomyces sp. PT12]|uniref:TetR/AcrR family transcriptional regulator n=1 Tax=Streptomyces sp. PT12 TaxID=1510197 RepID=UPI000DE5260E|nr:TetR/AcrR family transcriptional regulator [Streptomyces sp. PT12]RBM20676.1 TetR family transcriptional regulator [Streptomyces sp. PT12]
MRKTANERREDVVRAALSGFSRYGLHGTSTDSIARDVGISQPYLFRLFPTKRDIFLTAGRVCFERTYHAFATAARGKTGEDALAAMRQAYGELAADRELPLMQMQLYVAASSDEAVRQQVSAWWKGLWTLVSQTTGLPPHSITDFMACGMLINVMVALGVSGDHQGWDVLGKHGRNAMGDLTESSPPLKVVRALFS